MNGEFSSAAARRALPLIAAAVLGTPAVAAAAADDGRAEGERLVEQFVARVQSMRGRFQQQLIDADDEIAETSSGTFEILRPGRFRWEYVEPYAQVLVADGTNVWNYDVDLEQVTVKPQGEALGSTPAALLGGTENVLDGFTVAGSYEDRGTQWVRLEPKSHDTSFETVQLGFSDGVLTRMMLSDDLDQTTLVALLDVAVNADLDPSDFRFSPPAGVDIVGRPAAPASGL